MNKKKISFYLLIIFIVIAILSVFINDFEIKNDDKCELQWYYNDANNVKQEIELPYKVESEKDTEVIIYADIPIESIDISTLFFRSVYQSVEIKVDDIVIYEYNEKTNEKFGLSMPRKLNIVNLPSDIKGKTISISIISPYNKYSGYFSNIEVGTSTQIIDSIYSQYSFGFILGLLLIFTNLCFMLINFLFYKSKITSPYLFYMFLTGVFVGVWLLGDSKLITLFLGNKFSNELIYVGLLCFTLLFTIFLKKVFDNTFKKFINVMFIVALVNLLGQVFLQHFTITDFVYKMPINLLIIFVLFVSYFVHCLKNIVDYKKKNDKVFYTTTIEFVVVIILLILTATNLVLQLLTNINLNPFIGIAYFLLIVTIYVKTIVLVLKSAVSSTVYKARLKETQNYLMQSQMKPHFIFNTLGAIRTLIMSSPKVAYDMTTNFSKYLRANISTIEPGEKISFAQELDHIKAYVAIEQERFKNRINVIYDIECDSFYIPPLSVEPLVENAIKHGVCKRVKGGTVKITTKEFEDRYIVVVEDDGVGFDTSILETNDNNKSVGLKYIILRLKQLSDADFEINSEKGEGTKATITLWK